jgi:hypothetical protein
MERVVSCLIEPVLRCCNQAELEVVIAFQGRNASAIAPTMNFRVAVRKVQSSGSVAPSSRFLRRTPSVSIASAAQWCSSRFSQRLR